MERKDSKEDNNEDRDWRLETISRAQKMLKKVLPSEYKVYTDSGHEPPRVIVRDPQGNYLASDSAIWDDDTEDLISSTVMQEVLFNTYYNGKKEGKENIRNKLKVTLNL